MFFILGAGASCDSGLPTYRGLGGIYSNIQDVETKLSISKIYNGGLPEVWSFLDPLYGAIKAKNPGPTYSLIKELVQKFPGSAILTQNIDGYAKIVDVPLIEMHGNYETMTCTQCYVRSYSQSNNPYCDCGGICRPDIVLFGEMLDRKNVQKAFLHVKYKKFIVVIGTTLEFPYLRNFIAKGKARGAKVIHINPDPDYDNKVFSNERWIKATAAEGLAQLL